MNSRIYFVTSNSRKVYSLQRRLKDLPYDIVQKNIKLNEIQSDSIKEVAIAKANFAYKKLKKPLIVNDSGLVIPELNNFPGPYTKYVTNTIGNKGILKLLENNLQRSAYTTQTLVYIDEYAKQYVFEDRVWGSIANYENNIETDVNWGKIWNIFIPKGADNVQSALSEKEYDRCRKHAQENSVWESLYKILLKRVDNER